MLTKVKRRVKKELREAKRSRKQKDILYVAHNDLMLSYLVHWRDLLSSYDQIRQWFYFFDRRTETQRNVRHWKERFNLKSVHPFIAARFPWDLVIQADHGGFYSAFHETIPRVYVAHGVSTGKAISWLYGRRNTVSKEDKPIYEKMFLTSELEVKWALRETPDLQGTLVDAGSLLVDHFLSVIGKSSQIRCGSRRRLTIISTWGKDSLIQQQGDVLLAQIGELSRRYDVTISIHPMNYEKIYSGGKDWRAILEEVESLYGVRVIKNAFDWVPALAATDVLVTDHTSLHVYYLLTDRPVIFLDLGCHLIERDSPIHEIKRVSLCVESLTNLERCIRAAADEHRAGCFLPMLSCLIGRLGCSKGIILEELSALLGVELSNPKKTLKISDQRLS